MSTLKWTTLLATGSAAVLGTGIYLFQTKLIYPASLPSGSRENVDTPDRYGMTEYESFYLNTSDGERLHCYLMMQTKDVARQRPTVLIFHANAGNMGHRLPIAREFYYRMGLNVAMLSYRGYGKSTGNPNEIGIKIDADTFLEYVLHHETLKQTKLFAYGQSIGGAVAIHVVHKNQARFAGLVVENTFLSIRSLIPTVLPLARPLAAFCHQYWNSEAIIDTLSVPILFLSGRKDEIVPSSQMDRLYSACQSEKKEWQEFANGTHNDTVMQKGYMQYIHDFIRRNSG